MQPEVRVEYSMHVWRLRKTDQERDSKLGSSFAPLFPTVLYLLYQCISLSATVWSPSVALEETGHSLSQELSTLVGFCTSLLLYCIVLALGDNLDFFSVGSSGFRPIFNPKLDAKQTWISTGNRLVTFAPTWH